MSGSPSPRPRVLLTGASGDVGTRLRPMLVETYGALRSSDLVEPRTPPLPGETFVRADLSDAAQVARAVEGIDAIVHLGGFSVEGPWEAILQANIVGTHALYEAARLAGVRRVVFASSNHAVGFYERGRTVDHAVPPRPDTRYGVSKAFGEALGALYADKHGLRVLNIRIGNVADAPVDRRRLAIWLHPRDLMQLVRIGIEHPDVHCEIVYGASDNARAWWDNRRAHELGYRPRARAEDHAAAVLARDEPADPVGDRFQGGAFCSQEFDHPEPARSGTGGAARADGAAPTRAEP
ncbi:MAG TPA: NAD(P)-dependent oxidoreductase [Burkholderiaceae bacterium]|nr:NAD(P)-dependent oxidoreductase [Burkholderiaceae bacterium]